MAKKRRPDAAPQIPPAPLADDSATTRLWSYEALVDSLPICVLCKDREGRIVIVNEAAANLMGKPAAEIKDKTDFDLFPRELAEKYRADDAWVMETGKTFEDVEAHDSGGEVGYVEVRKTPLRNTAGDIVGIEAVFADVTERKRTEEALEKEQYLFHVLMDNLPDSIYFKDRASRFIRVNKGLVEKFGFHADQILGKSDADIFSAEHAQAAREDELRIMEEGQGVLGKIEKETWEDRPVTWCSSSKLPFHDKTGAVAGTFGITRDVTELIRTEEALRLAKDEADAANRAKSDFLANMSHEIRTPMNAIIGMTELLLHAGPTPSQAEYLSMVLASGESLLALINDILDFSKIEAGKFELDTHDFDLRNAIGDTMKSLGFRAHEKNLELALSIDEGVPEILHGDIGRLRQILINLVGNAIKFTPAGEVVLEIESEDTLDDQIQLRFSVRDTGIGIPADKLEKIFGQFEQVDSSTTRTYGGTGLGLAISSRLIELMGGKIWVESQPNIGSTFRFTTRFGHPTDSSDHPGLSVESIAGLKTLVVDDNETNRRIMHDMLRAWGMQPILAASAADGMQALHEAQRTNDPIELVLTDLNMPEIDGFMLTELIRSEPALADVPVVMLTSGGTADNRQRCQELQITRRLLKPVKQSEMFDAIADALDRAPRDREFTTQGQPSAALRSLRVLLAEDNLVNQKLAVGVLKQQGHDVVVADNGLQAWQMWESEPFDLILMDVQMPEMDGYDATRMIRKKELGSGKRIPIIAMTARAMSGDRERCLAAGMDEYLSKPIRIEQLNAKIAEMSDEATGQETQIIPHENFTSSGVDWEAALGRVNGSHELMREITQAFLGEVPQLMQRMRDDLARGDLNSVKLNAHSVKGSLLFFTEDDVVNSAKHFETLDTHVQMEEVLSLFDRLNSQLEPIYAALREYAGEV